MGGSYRQCEECGKRALRIATRCPGCGRELTVLEVPETNPVLEFGRILSPSLLAGVIAAGVVLTAVELGPDSPPTDPSPAVATADTVAGYSASGYSAASFSESTDESPATRAMDTSTGLLDTAGVRLATTTAAAMTAPSTSEILVAPKWTYVRKARSRRAPLEAVLTPGDTVVADSLERDWYRVALEGEVLGYAHRSAFKPGVARPEASFAKESRGGS
jgi:hypothetical protein